MNAKYIALAVPFFLVLIAIELAVARARRKVCYRLGDVVGDIGCGMVQQVTLVFTAGAVIAGYTYLYEHHRLIELSPAAAWIVALVGVDFLYYWWHRLSHEVNILWVAHIVHHQSEDYNLAVALRQAILTSWTAQIFYVPLAFLGVPPLIFGSVNAISTLYQFWIHTELVGKLGWFERWFNTPSLHRVHHAVNPQYLDKNYGATLIVWDRIFGTYELEVEPPVYGVVKPLGSFNPVWAQFEPLVSLARASLAAPRFADKIRVWFKSPAWRPEGVAPYPGVEDGSYLRRPKYDPPATRPLTAYVLVQFALGVSGTAALMFTQKTADPPVLAAGAALVLLTLFASAGLIEGRRWAPPFELARIALAAAAAIAASRAGWLPGWAIPAAAIAGAAVGLWMLRAVRSPAPPAAATAG
jgi:sterol desaturase/sphingolipid hydroxylase (fatty acid hydroxylase superfamily)